MTKKLVFDADTLYAAWHKVGADIRGLKFADFCQALEEQPSVQNPITDEMIEAAILKSNGHSAPEESRTFYRLVIEGALGIDSDVQAQEQSEPEGRWVSAKEYWEAPTPVVVKQTKPEMATIMNAFRRVMNEETIPAIVKAVHEREEAAEAISKILLTRNQSPQGELVTLESALAAIDHVAYHNGPGREKEAMEMLQAVSTPQQPEEIRTSALEEAAKLCEPFTSDLANLLRKYGYPFHSTAVENIPDAIRALALQRKV